MGAMKDLMIDQYETQETVGEYNSKHYGKAWYIVGVTHDGAATCSTCAHSWPLVPAMNEPIAPLFMSDSFDLTCDACGDAI
jgi:hypothetical protein